MDLGQFAFGRHGIPRTQSPSIYNFPYGPLDALVSGDAVT